MSETNATREMAVLRERYAPIISQGDELARLKIEAGKIRRDPEDIRQTYAEKRKILDRLEEQVAGCDERLAFADPDDRVREPGDASVPFGFDIHAMIYSGEAPALDASLHREFADRRINMSNMRKEFFRVGLEKVEQAFMRISPSANFFKDREAQEWHETLARRNETLRYGICFDRLAGVHLTLRRGARLRPGP